MFGGIHIDSAVWNSLGECLNDSDWITTVLTNADVALSVTSESFPGCSCLTKTRGAHQITSPALAMHQNDVLSSPFSQTIKK